MGPDRLHLLGRRNFLATLANIGVSSSAVAHMTSDKLKQLTDDPSERIPRLSRLERTGEPPYYPEEPPEREPVYYTIDRDEWAHREGALQASEELADRLSDERPGRFRTTVTTRPDTGYSRRAVRVTRIRESPEEAAGRGSGDLPHIDDVRGEIPETLSTTVGSGSFAVEVDGIPTVVDEQHRRVLLGTGSCSYQDSTQYYNNYYDYLVAGIQGESGGNLGDSARDWMTFTAPVHDHDRNASRLLTVNHGVNPPKGMFQPCKGHHENAVGYTDKTPANSSYDGDVATVDMTGTTRYSLSAIASESSATNGLAIEGTVGFDELYDNQDNDDYELYFQGRSTGRQEVSLSDVNQNGDTGRIEIGTMFPSPEGGDSGGTIFKKDGSNFAYIAGIFQGTDIVGPSAEVHFGAVMDLVEDALNVSC